MSVRAGRLEDLTAVVALEESSFARPWTSAQLAAELAAGGERALVAQRDGEIAGYLCYRVIADQAELLRIAVAAQRRRGGVASELLQDLRRRLLADGVRRLFLEVRATNSAAIALYRKRGFVVVGRRRGYYDDGENALLFCLELDGSCPGAS